MKLNHIVAPPQTHRVVQQFGGASLIKLRNGQHELIGGSDADRATAFEWVSLFAHEIVFTNFSRRSSPGGERPIFDLSQQRPNYEMPDESVKDRE